MGMEAGSPLTPLASQFSSRSPWFGSLTTRTFPEILELAGHGISRYYVTSKQRDKGVLLSLSERLHCAQPITFILLLSSVILLLKSSRVFLVTFFLDKHVLFAIHTSFALFCMLEV